VEELARVFPDYPWYRLFTELTEAESVNRSVTNVTKPLIETNPYLKDPVQRQSLLWRAVASSSAIEGARLGVSRTSARKAIHAAAS